MNIVSQFQSRLDKRRNAIAKLEHQARIFKEGGQMDRALGFSDFAESFAKAANIRRNKIAPLVEEQKLDIKMLRYVYNLQTEAQSLRALYLGM